MAENKGTEAVSVSIRTGGVQPVQDCDNGSAAFLLQTFGAEKTITHNYCAISDKLKGTRNMQAFLPGPLNIPDPNDENYVVDDSGPGPFRSVSYQARRVLVNGGSAEYLLFNGTEQFAGVFCNDEDGAIDNPSSCSNDIIL